MEDKYWTLGNVIAFGLLMLCIISVLLSLGLQAITGISPAWNGYSSPPFYSQSSVDK